MVAPPARLALVLALLPPAPLQAQGGGDKPDFARHAYVIQRLDRVIRYEADGTGRTTVAMRASLQSPAALQSFGQLTFPYSSENQRVEIDRLLVLKPSGDTIHVPASAIQDLTGPIAQDAPMYSDLRQKVVTVPGIRPGDTLDYHVTWTTHTPFAPGNFWDAEQFTRSAIVLDERITFDVPRQTQVQIKTEGGPAPRVTDAGDRRRYEWRRPNLAVDTTGRHPSFLTRSPRYGVQMTTFRSWADVGAWYAGLERDREAVTPEIRQRAQELVRGRTTLLDSIAALYDYVSTQFRYVSLQFGLGRYQPHRAAEVLSNQYGDCKDKHVLLAALLRVIGVRTAPVLISSLEPIDPDMPAPGQFDHLITFVQAGRDSLWLDATPGVAPFRFLLYNLRGKQGLLLPEQGPARLARAPDSPPFPTYTLVEATGTLIDVGRLNLGIRYETRGDGEVILREVFRQLPEDRWRAFAQRYAQLSKLPGGGTVQSAAAADPVDTRQPFTFTFQIEKPDAVSWSNRTAEFAVPLPELELPDHADDSSGVRDSLLLGIQALTSRLRLVLPRDVTVRVPGAVTLQRDYGTYGSRVDVRADTLIVERSVTFKKRVLPPERADDLASFTRVIEEDQDRTLTFTRTTAGPAAAAVTSENTNDVHRLGMQALDAGDGRGAVRAFRRVTELEARHQYAWNNLGRAYLQLGKLDSAQIAFRKQIEINPYDQYAHNNLGLALRRAGRHEDAVAAFRQQIEINPLDRWAHANLGSLLVEMRRDSAAAEALTQAVSITPDDTSLHVLLGKTYLRLRRGRDAIAVFDRAVSLAQTPDMWNDIAYALALERTELDTAEAYARRAIDATSSVLRDVSVDDAGMREMIAVLRLGAYWDTMGWIYFARGDLKNAERYIRAAWLLTFESAIGDHLGQIEQRLGRTADAIRTYTLAMVAPTPSATIWPRLVRLLGGSEREADRRIELARQEFTTMRTVKLGKVLVADVSGEVQLLFAPPGPGQTNARVEGVKVTSGPAQLERLKTAIRGASYQVAFPDADAPRLLRRAVVTCSSPSGQCALVLIPTPVLRTFRAMPGMDRLR